MRILLLTWAFPDADTPMQPHRYRIVLDEQGVNCPPRVTIERLGTAAAGEEVWRPSNGNLRSEDLDRDTLYACAMARLSSMATRTWIKRDDGALVIELGTFQGAG